MPKIQYIERNFQSKSLTLIEKCNSILQDYSAQGYDMTLRQLYYQLVSQDVIPNNQKQYDNLGSLVNDARLAGLVDWNDITDRTRNVKALTHWKNPSAVIQATIHNFRLDKWKEQINYVEVWIEKDALGGIFERICQKVDIPYFSCRGYTSQSEMWIASRRLDAQSALGKSVKVLHFGDHDASGLDMTRDIAERLELFCGFPVQVKRLALNFDQIQAYQPPPNPAKLTDSRATDYIRKFGHQSWELDALQPDVLAELVQDEIDELLDLDRWNEVIERETNEREILTKISQNFEAVSNFLESFDE